MGNSVGAAVGGVVVEEQKLTWRIQNFSVVKEHDELIEDQSFEFEAGDSLGLSSKWEVYFRCDEEEDPGYIGIYLRLVERPKTKLDYLFADFSFKIKTVTGRPYENSKMETKDYNLEPGTGWGFSNFIKKTDSVPLVRGSLLIQCKFRLYGKSATLKKLSVGNMLEEFHSSSKAKAGGDLARLIKLPVSCSGGIEICSSDGKQFQTRKEVLAVRSPVFEAMFESGMKEAAEGKLELDDTTSQTVEVLLHYFCTGELLTTWRQTDVILELTNSAAKYQLQELLGFLDKALGKVCDDGNVLPLLNLADKLDLKEAKKGLVKFMKKEGFTSKNKSGCCIV